MEPWLKLRHRAKPIACIGL